MKTSGKHNQQIGSAGQNVAAGALRALGVEMVEQIGTPVRLVPVGQGSGVYRVIWGDKVSGDHRGILRGGTSVLAETKTIIDRNLRYSDMREHQPERLTEHAQRGGVSLLVWVHRSGVYVMQFPIAGFERGKSIEIKQAVIASIHTEMEVERIIVERMKYEKE